jgi:hypothetical protein
MDVYNVPAITIIPVIECYARTCTNSNIDVAENTLTKHIKVLSCIINVW